MSAYSLGRHCGPPPSTYVGCASLRLLHAAYVYQGNAVAPGTGSNDSPGRWHYLPVEAGLVEEGSRLAQMTMWD